MAASTIDRRELLPHLFPEPDNYLFISGLAGPARDAAALTNDGANIFTMAGTMGAATTVGLGVALSAPDSQVAVITGDGELLMNIGSLATIASMQPMNLTLVCIDNASHGETGGQPGHTSRSTDLAKIAEGSGISSVMSISSPDEIAGAAAFLQEAPAPRFLICRVMTGAPSAIKRNMNLAECRLRFRNAYLASA